MRTLIPRASQLSGVGVFSANMVLKPNTLVAGSSYTFSLSAAYISDERRGRLQEDGAANASSASVSLWVNSPPSGGTFEVAPTEGKRHELIRSKSSRRSPVRFDKIDLNERAMCG